MILGQNKQEQIIFVANTDCEEEAKKLESVATALIETFGAEFFTNFNQDLIIEGLNRELEVEF